VKVSTFFILLISSIFLNGCDETTQSLQELSSSMLYKAVDNTGAEVIKPFETYEIVVLSDTKLNDDKLTSQSSKALYGTINGKLTEALLKLNSNYSGEMQIGVEVYENSKLIGSTQAIKIGTQNAIDFGSIITK